MSLVGSGLEVKKYLVAETGVNMARKIKKIHHWVGSNSLLIQHYAQGCHQ